MVLLLQKDVGDCGVNVRQVYIGGAKLTTGESELSSRDSTGARSRYDASTLAGDPGIRDVNATRCKSSTSRREYNRDETRGTK